MDASARAKQIQDVFAAALEQPQSDREAFVSQACSDDVDSAAEVLALLEVHELLAASDALFEEPSETIIGSTIGSYKVIRLLGEGGMGRVYLASRADGSFQRDVAIKVIGDRLAPDLARRFEQERRILASLRHPNIAVLLDAGVTPAGRRYFIMEYIDGRPVTDYCQAHQLDLPARVDLFLRICGAVAHAHHNLVVHRDLKPSNILVDQQGQPKLLDFGIAKTLTAAHRDSDPTDPRRKRLTPAYASPELIGGQPAHTTMDVYALGILLYELLTDTRAPRADMQSAQPITPPSDCLEENLPQLLVRAKRERGVVLPRQLRGDLDAIVGRALAPDWRHRYPSVEALAGDLRAWVSGRPVDARGGGVWYRSRKFIRRNATVSAAAAISLCALLLAVGVLFRLWTETREARDRANRRLDAVAGLASSMFDVDRALARLNGATMARRGLADALSRYLATTSKTDDERLLLDAARAHQRLGDIEGNVNGSNLGRPAEAVAHYDQAIRIFQALRANGDQPGVKVALAQALASRADVRAGQEAWDDAEAGYSAALSLVPEAGSTLSPPELSVAASVHRSLGDVRLRRGNPADALSHYERALALNRSAAAVQSSSGPDERRVDALTQIRLGDARLASGALTQARAHYEEAATTLELLAGDARDRDLMRDAALGYARLAVTLNASDVEAGLGEFDRALGILRMLVASDPADARAQRDLMATLFEYSEVLERRDPQRWRATLDEARAIARRRNAEQPDDPTRRQELAAIEGRLAGSGSVSLQLVSGSGQPIAAGGEPVRLGQLLRAVARVPPGWSRYLLVFGAEGPAEILDERALAAMQWTIAIKGPMPAETVLLIAAASPLTSEQRSALTSSIDGVTGSRSVGFDSHIIWRDRTDRIETVAASRGTPERTPWTEEIQRRMAALGNVRVIGRTFPVAPQVE